MKTLISKIILFVFFSLSAACSKSQIPEEPEKPVVKVPDAVDPPSSSTEKWLPVRLQSPEQSIVLSYLGTSNQLASITDSKGLTITFQYKADQPIGYVVNESKQIYYNDFFRDATKRINRVIKYQDNGVITPGGEFQIDYNDSGEIFTVRYYSARNVLLKTKLLSYNDTGDITGIQVDQANSGYDESLHFDQKAGIFKYVPMLPVLFIETDLDLFASTNHNLLRRSGKDGEVNYTYQHQSEGYPNQMTRTMNGQKSTYKITYKTFN